MQEHKCLGSEKIGESEKEGENRERNGMRKRESGN